MRPLTFVTCGFLNPKWDNFTCIQKHSPVNQISFTKSSFVHQLSQQILDVSSKLYMHVATNRVLKLMSTLSHTAPKLAIERHKR